MVVTLDTANRNLGAAVRLDQLKPGDAGVVVEVTTTDLRARRLIELGLAPGRRIRFVQRAPLLDPILVQVGEGVYSLRRDDAAYLMVLPDSPVHD